MAHSIEGDNGDYEREVLINKVEKLESELEQLKRGSENCDISNVKTSVCELCNGTGELRFDDNDNFVSKCICSKTDS